MSAQLEAKREADFEEYFEQARQGFVCKPKNWPILTEKLFNEIDEFAINQAIAANWYDEAEIGRIMKEHFSEAWYRVFSEMGLDE